MKCHSFFSSPLFAICVYVCFIIFCASLLSRMDREDPVSKLCAEQSFRAGKCFKGQIWIIFNGKNEMKSAKEQICWDAAERMKQGQFLVWHLLELIIMLPWHEWHIQRCGVCSCWFFGAFICTVVRSGGFVKRKSIKISHNCRKSCQSERLFLPLSLSLSFTHSLPKMHSTRPKTITSLGLILMNARRRI